MNSDVLSVEQAGVNAPGYPYPDLVCRFLLMISVVTLPFTYAGTLNVGFPLKVYEVANLLLFLTYIIHWATDRSPQLVFQLEERRAIGLACAYFVAAIISSVYGYEILKDYRMVIRIDSWRHDPSIASALKIGYLFFDIFVFAYIIGIKGIPLERICNWWIIGAVLAALYGWYLFIASVSGHNPIPLPGQERLQAGAPPFPNAIRSGTFVEGNFVSLYYLVSTVLGFMMFCRTWMIRYAFLGGFFLFSQIHTLSTIGVLSNATFLMIAFIMTCFTSRVSVMIAIPAFWLMICGGSVVAMSPYFQSVVIDKLSDSSDSAAEGSRLERENSILAGYDMFKEHPLFGIGLSNYGYLYPYYSQFSSSDDPSSRGDIKAITNNIYSEVSTETGIVGSVIFLSFCAYVTLLYRKSLRDLPQRIMLAGIFGVFVAWLAYPTFSILFQWVFFALAIRLFLETPDTI
jgi:O-antigen ligase